MLDIQEPAGDPNGMKLYRFRNNLKDCFWDGDYQYAENIAFLL